MTYEQQRTLILQQLADFSGGDFDALALEVFRFQAALNPLYAHYLNLLGLEAANIHTIDYIPFLPIQFFKNYTVKTGQWVAETSFTSSGTTGAATSTHPVRDLDFYKHNTVQGFLQHYGHPSDYCVLALLPSYLERSGSSLVCMAGHFIDMSKYPKSGFFLNNTAKLVKVLEEMQAANIPVILLGVSFALLDLAEQQIQLSDNTIVMETGGMKGRRQELTREELHQQLKAGFKVNFIHSEYGMTELFSQAYSKGNGIFQPAHSMRALCRDITDPLSILPPGKNGALNIIDLANFDTCSFIATDDIGKVWENGTFEVLGRLDNSDIRGCNLLVG